MQDAEPAQSPTRWKPHQSVVGGATVGGFLAVLVVKGLEHYFKTPLDDITTTAITGLCTFAATYFIPDSPNSP
jgi:fructose-specific phosphotransferase system IIC component